MNKKIPELDTLYREIILDHYKCPRGRGKIECPDITFDGYNPVCGDEVNISLKFNDGKIEEVAVNATGCAISVAAGSMLAELLPGKNMEEIREIGAQFQKLLQGEEKNVNLDKIGDLDTMEGVSKFPVRIKCALLAWKTIEHALQKHSDEHHTHTKTTVIE